MRCPQCDTTHEPSFRFCAHCGCALTAGVRKRNESATWEDAEARQRIKRASNRPDVWAGQQLGPYQLLRLLGRGGMGTVYLAHDKALERTVAVKVLLEEGPDSREQVTRFLGEARSVARVPPHPNVVEIFHIASQGTCHFFAMEYVEGCSLHDEVMAKGPLPTRRALELLQQAVQGLAAANRAGVIHRDVKPANLLLTNEGVVKVADFGLAKRSELKGEAITRVGAVMGTPQFMSPEQGRGSEVDHRSDIYSLGATLYFLLSGRYCYDDTGAMKIILKHISDPVPQFERAPPSINLLLRRMMAKNREERFPTWPAVGEHIGRILRSGVLRDKPILEIMEERSVPHNPPSEPESAPTTTPSNDAALLEGIEKLMRDGIEGA